MLVMPHGFGALFIECQLLITLLRCVCCVCYVVLGLGACMCCDIYRPPS